MLSEDAIGTPPAGLRNEEGPHSEGVGCPGVLGSDWYKAAPQKDGGFWVQNPGAQVVLNEEKEPGIAIPSCRAKDRSPRGLLEFCWWAESYPSSVLNKAEVSSFTEVSDRQGRSHTTSRDFKQGLRGWDGWRGDKALL